MKAPLCWSLSDHQDAQAKKIRSCSGEHGGRATGFAGWQVLGSCSEALSSSPAPLRPPSIQPDPLMKTHRTIGLQKKLIWSFLSVGMIPVAALAFITLAASKRIITGIAQSYQTV